MVRELEAKSGETQIIVNPSVTEAEEEGEVEKITPPEIADAREEQLRISIDMATARKKKGFSQEQIARAVGVSRSAYAKWERGDKPVPAARKAAVEKVLGIGL